MGFCAGYRTKLSAVGTPLIRINRMVIVSRRAGPSMSVMNAELPDPVDPAAKIVSPGHRVIAKPLRLPVTICAVEEGELLKLSAAHTGRYQYPEEVISVSNKAKKLSL